jgi:hypothetical protein
MKVRSQAPSPGLTWEYLVITTESESAAVLAEYGSQGWELVTVVREFGTRATFYFKRRRS